VLNNIAQWNEPQINQNISVTILNDSKDGVGLNKSLSKDYINPIKKGNKFRVLKSSVLVDGVKYKISVSLLLLC
jgi:predicted transcriptional regulator